MCSNIDVNLDKFTEFMNFVEKRLGSHNQKLTQNKKQILKILFFTKEHLNSTDISKISLDKYDFRLDLTTIYRVLSSLETYRIIDSIMVDDKRRYEICYLKSPHYHLYCQFCSKVIEFEDIDIHDKFLQELKNIKFQATGFNIIINGVCQKCQ